MELLDSVRRFRATGVPRDVRAQARRDLVAATLALATLRIDRAWEHIDAAHEATRNAGVLHAFAHGFRCVGMAARGRPKAALGEVPLLVMATPIAWTRRAAGVRNEEPGGQGVRTTWRGRRPVG